MNRQMTCGTSSISFQNPVFIQSCASVVSRKEGEGPLGAYFDTICEDPMFGTDTWEAAESTLQKQAALLAIKKNGLTCSDIQLLFAGDLLAQTSASSFGTADLKNSFLRSFRSMLHYGRISFPWFNVYRRRVRKIYPLRNFQPLCQRRKRISFSTKLCESKTIVCPLDCDWKWSVSCGGKGEPCEDKWSDSGKNCGLRSERLTEYGSMYGSGRM